MTNQQLRERPTMADHFSRWVEYANQLEAALEAAEQRAEQAERERDTLRQALERAVYLAEHLFQMVTPQQWRDSGGDDGQGHYEGEYRAEQLREELSALSSLPAAPDPDYSPAYQDEYQRLWHKAAEDRRRLIEAIGEAIEHWPGVAPQGRSFYALMDALSSLSAADLVGTDCCEHDHPLSEPCPGSPSAAQQEQPYGPDAWEMNRPGQVARDE